MTTILIADDHPIVLEGLVSLLQSAAYSVVARCTTGPEVLAALQQTQPDMVLLDINMPRPGGLEIARTLNEAGSASKIVLLTSNLDDSQVEQAARLGVDGIVLKETAPQQLMTCLETVRAGLQWIDPEVARRAFKTVVPNEAGGQLTPRELDVVKLVARGLRNKEIARELNITEGTVKMYLHNMYERLQVSSRIELTNAARGKGIL
jgi:two-component system, NarL family, nitrate/nitrite response regulator NarL